MSFGAVNTSMNLDWINNSKERERVLEKIPLKKIFEPENIAKFTFWTQESERRRAAAPVRRGPRQHERLLWELYRLFRKNREIFTLPRLTAAAVGDIIIILTINHRKGSERYERKENTEAFRGRKGKHLGDRGYLSHRCRVGKGV